MRNIFTLAFAFFVFQWGHSQVMISQYIETNSGSVPKGIEIVNYGSVPIDFAVTPLEIFKGVNGASPSLDHTVSSGVLGVGEVIVIGTTNMDEPSEMTNPCDNTLYSTKTFTFNGDDALEVYLNGTIQDVFGMPGMDPGTSWSGNGVSTRNSNIGLLASITAGDTDGWTDPSERFENIAGGQDLTGFGTPPGGCPITAPVELVSITAKSRVSVIDITWTTASEINNDYFQVEKSRDGVTFEAIGTVNGNGTSHNMVDYSYTDKAPFNGVNYYRLKQVDYDGAYEYSPIVTATVSNTKITVSPKQTYDRLIVTASDNAAAQVAIISMDGQLVSSQSFDASAELDLSSLVKGMYLVRVESEGTVMTEKIVKL